MAFADQMSNVAGPLFATSLLPYLAFLTFLGHKGNRVPPLALFGFRFLLCFVAATIPQGLPTVADPPFWATEEVYHMNMFD